MDTRFNLFGSALITFLSLGLFVETNAIGQTLSPIQTPDRPAKLDIVGPVMLAASDNRAASFEKQIQPIVINIIRKQLASNQTLRNAADHRINPAFLTVSERPTRPIRIYFIDEGSGYHDCLGISIVPFNPLTDVQKPKLIFPNIAKPARPGEAWTLLAPQLERTILEPLKTGDFVDLPNVKKGDMLDFFLISNGYYGGTTFLWNDPKLNPCKLVHMVAFEVPGHPEYMIIGFENMIGGGDLDYEDIVFVIDHGMNLDDIFLPH